MEKKSSKLTIIAIIQARMGSTRLPGKVLMEIEGKPMLWHVVERVKQAKNIDEVVLAIPNTKGNDVLEDFALKNNIKYYRGSEEDVLSRYYKAAEKFQADRIVRITSDCPLIDPGIIDLIVRKHLNSDADFTANFLEGKGGATIKRSFPRGLEIEIFSFSTLEKANLKAQNDFQREHVDPYIFGNPEEFKIKYVGNKEDLSALRWTVDETNDLEFVREIYKKLYKQGRIFSIKNILDLLEKFSWVIEINKSVKQKQYEVNE